MKRNSSQRVQSILKQLHSLQIGEIADLERELSRSSNRALLSILGTTVQFAFGTIPPADDEPSEPTLPFGDDAPLAPSIDEGP